MRSLHSSLCAERKMKDSVFFLGFFVTATVLLLTVEAQPEVREEANTSEGVNITDVETPVTGSPLLREVANTTMIRKTCPESHPRNCIRSVIDLRQAFLETTSAPGSRPDENTIFSFTPNDAAKYTSLAMFFDYSYEERGNQPDSNSTNSRECCNPVNASSCMVFFRHRSYVYRALYAPLIFLYAFPTTPNFLGSAHWFNKRLRKYGVRKLCWKVPPLCTKSGRIGGYNDKMLLEAFTAEFPHLVLSANEGPIEVGPVDKYDPKHWDEERWDAITEEEKTAVNSVILSVFIMTIPLFLLAMDTYSTTISTVLIKSRFAANCVYMVMFQSWFLVAYFIINTVQILNALLLTTLSSEKYLYDHLMPDVVLCFTVFGVEAAVILIELPFICCYFWRSPVVRDVYVKKSGQPGLLKLRKGAESLGWMGIVVFCQFFSAMMCYMTMFLFIDPLYAITRVGITVLVMLFTAVLTLYFGLCCANCCSCTSCTCQKFHKFFLVTMALLVACCSNLLACQSLPQPFKDRSGMMATGVFSSVGSSAMLALFGYLCKKLVWNRITQEVKDFDEMAQNRKNTVELQDKMIGAMPMLSASTEESKDTKH